MSGAAPAGSATPVVHALPNRPKVELLDAGAEFIRVHLIGKGAVWFGPAAGSLPAYRFDAPGGQYRVLYAARRIKGAFVETVLHRKNRLLTRAFVDARSWTVLRLRRGLRIAKLYDEGLRWHGTDARVSSDTDYSHARAVALAIWSSSPDIDGLAYRSSHNDGEVCYALFNRVGAGDVEEAAHHGFADNEALVGALMAEHGAVFDTSSPVPPPPP